MEIFLYKNLNYSFGRDKSVTIAPTYAYVPKTFAHDVIWQMNGSFAKINPQNAADNHPL